MSKLLSHHCRAFKFEPPLWITGMTSQIIPLGGFGVSYLCLSKAGNVVEKTLQSIGEFWVTVLLSEPCYVAVVSLLGFVLFTGGLL